MQLNTANLAAIWGFFTFVPSVLSLNCYTCQSNQPGCGKEINIRIQRLSSCRGTGQGGYENFCVKVIEKRGSDYLYTRECLETLMLNTRHRERIPTVQRHGYCLPSRNNDPFNPNDASLTYCFCNDWNGCNTASGLKVKVAYSLLLALVTGLWSSLSS